MLIDGRVASMQFSSVVVVCHPCSGRRHGQSCLACHRGSGSMRGAASQPPQGLARQGIWGWASSSQSQTKTQPWRVQPWRVHPRRAITCALSQLPTIANRCSPWQTTAPTRCRGMVLSTTVRYRREGEFASFTAFQTATFFSCEYMYWAPSGRCVAATMVHESFDEVMNLIELPGPTSSPTRDPSSPVRYAGLYPAWVLGEEIEGYTPMRQAYGGHVYTQSSLAAVRAMEAARKAASPAQPTPDMLGIHVS